MVPGRHVAGPAKWALPSGKITPEAADSSNMAEVEAEVEVEGADYPLDS